MKFGIMTIGLLLSLQLGHAETCTYNIKEGSHKLTWTGYKFTNKTAVSGTFDNIKFEQKPAKSVQALIKTISFKVDTKSVSTGNEARDMTLAQSIFGLLKTPDTISGKFTEVSESGVVKAEAEINAPTPMVFQLNQEDDKITLTGSLDLLENDLKKSYDALHKACQGLHTGEDKVSKTWSTADIKIEAQIEEKCSKGFIDSIKSWFS